MPNPFTSPLQKPAEEVTDSFTVGDLAKLNMGQRALSVLGYEESDDTFSCILEQDTHTERVNLPGVLLTILVGECGEPSEFVQRIWLITQPGF